jgi:hypothetical protein
MENTIGDSREGFMPVLLTDTVGSFSLQLLVLLITYPSFSESSRDEVVTITWAKKAFGEGSSCI